MDSLTTNIEEEEIKNDFLIYPNPSDGRFTADLHELDYSLNAIPVVIYDMTGKIIKQSSIQDSKMHIDISNKNEGVYIIRIGNLRTEKIFIH